MAIYLIKTFLILLITVNGIEHCVNATLTTSTDIGNTTVLTSDSFNFVGSRPLWTSLHRWYFFAFTFAIVFLFRWLYLFAGLWCKWFFSQGNCDDSQLEFWCVCACDEELKIQHADAIMPCERCRRKRVAIENERRIRIHQNGWYEDEKRWWCHILCLALIQEQYFIFFYLCMKGERIPFKYVWERYNIHNTK